MKKSEDLDIQNKYYQYFENNRRQQLYRQFQHKAGYGVTIGHRYNFMFNGKGYDSLVEALGNLIEGENLLVLQNDVDLDEIEEEGTVFPMITESLEIDLNGHTFKDNGIFRYVFVDDVTQAKLGKTIFQVSSNKNMTLTLKNGKIDTESLCIVNFKNPNGNLTIDNVQLVNENQPTEVFKQGFITSEREN